jgi:hypothetical protein
MMAQPHDKSGPLAPPSVVEQLKREALELAERQRKITETLRIWDPTYSGTELNIPERIFVGLDIADALRVYLAMRNGAAPFDDAIRDLKAGGCEIGSKPGLEHRHMKSMLGQPTNRKIFRFDEESGIISLIAQKQKH